jgi:uncharacterized protein (DUF58 family)
MRIKNLELRAKAVVDGFYNGLHRSPFHGFSVEFSEYRQYTPGDDPRYLDWRLYARSDRYYIKRFEDETNRRCYLLLDLSRSMGYSSGGHTKADYARTLAATLSYYLTLQRDNVGLLVFDREIVDFLPARYRPGHLQRLISCLERSEQGTGTNLHVPLEQVAQTVKKRGLVVLISDLLASLETLRTNLGYLRARGHDVLVLRVLDPAELEFPFRDAVLFRDMETGRDMYVDPGAARPAYREQFARHQEQITSICEELGVDFSTLLSDRPLEKALFDLLHAQLQRGRRNFRRVAGTAAPRGGSA